MQMQTLIPDKGYCSQVNAKACGDVGLCQVRYRGMAKNATRSFVALGLANNYLARQHLVE